jgi:hypothetical protein
VVLEFGIRRTRGSFDLGLSAIWRFSDLLLSLVVRDREKAKRRVLRDTESEVAGAGSTGLRHLFIGKGVAVPFFSLAEAHEKPVD